MTVRIMRSTDRGAPALAGQQGSMNALLMAALVAGFPTATPVGITRSGSEATCNMPGHGFVSTQTVSISGANEAEYNGNQIITVTDADNFTFPISGTPATPATGTILVAGEKTAGTITSLTRSGSIVTAVQAAHGFVTDNRVRVSGANEVQYNGWQKVTVLDADTYTFELPASATPNSPATGTIIARYGSCGLGWSRQFAVTNKSVFKQGARAGVTQAVLCADETDASNHTYGVGFHMAESATNAATYVNPAYVSLYPTSTGTLKSSTASATAKPWIVLGDHRTVIILTKPGTSTLPNIDGWLMSYFGDIISYLPNDAYPQLCAPTGRNSSYTLSSTSWAGNISTYAYNSWRYYNYANVYGASDSGYPLRMTRNHLGQVGKLQPSLCSGFAYHGNASVTLAQYAVGDRHASYSVDPYPDPVHGGVNMEKLFIKHGTAVDNTGNPVTRGELRGLMMAGHRRTQVAAWLNNDVIYGSGDTAGRVFEVIDLGNSSNSWVLLEISDTWGV